MHKVRFAPSPTGYLHVGNVRTALVNWLFARASDGHFLLRIDDTDKERSRAEYTDAIREDLAWLGLTWDSEEHQSARFDRYRLAADTLIGKGRLYICYETSEELDVQRKMQASRGLPPIYNRAALKLTDEQKAAYEQQGRKSHWRFKLEDEEISWDDAIRGRVAMRASTMSDPVLLREDGGPVYTLASVVDDGEMGITHVIRGEDHVSNTAVQIQLYKALGFDLPAFAHMALLKTRDGEMSKRLGGNDIRALRDAGILPMAVNSLLARIGTSDSVEACVSLEPLVASFSFDKFGRAPANYDVAELEKLNEKLLQQLPFAHVSGCFAHVPELDEPFWLSIRANIKTLDEAHDWWEIVRGGNVFAKADADKAFFVQALQLLPPEPWDETTWGAWTKALATASGRKGKELFMPIRQALTGKEHGPEMKPLLLLIGRDKVVARLG